MSGSLAVGQGNVHAQQLPYRLIVGGTTWLLHTCMYVAKESIDRILVDMQEGHQAHDQYLLAESIVGLCPTPTEETGI